MAKKRNRSNTTEVSTYRYKAGTKVLCRTGAEEWSAGQIVMLNYREPGWPQGKIVPYQVRLDDGNLIFVPIDSEQLCRELVPPWWAAAFNKPGSHYAKENPSAELLVKEAATNYVNARDHHGYTALMKAAETGWLNGISQLIVLKADVDIAGNKNTRALHLAATHGAGILKLLVEARADLNCQDEDPDFDPAYTSKTFGKRLEHRTPLHYVCSGGDVRAAKLLLDAHAHVDIQDAQLMTPLHLAIVARESKCVDLLLGFGANVNLGNQSSGVDNPPLMDAAAAGDTEFMEKLIASKADINKQGRQQMSALHLAARNQRVQAAEILLASRADMNQTSKAGSALQLARKNGGVNLLKVFGVESDATSPDDIITCVSSLDAAQRAALFLD